MQLHRDSKKYNVFAMVTLPRVTPDQNLNYTYSNILNKIQWISLARFITT